MRQDEIWDAATRRRPTTRPGAGMFAPDVLGPTVDRLADLAEPAAGCSSWRSGPGRVAVPLQERGVQVTGIEAVRADGGAAAATRSAEAELHRWSSATWRRCAPPGEFALAYLVFNTISNLLTQDEQVACFRNAARHLVPGGRFVIELWVPELR